MLFPWYIKYPNQNDEILNLDWILYTIDNLVKEVVNFVSLNTIKYADPIQWNITTQYEKNTVVIDPISGSAYISTKPVPAGVGLNNTDYWNIIFTLDVISANKNITLRDDANNMLATFESEEGDWLLWQGTLYVVTKSIEIGQSYVDNYNIERSTVEAFLKLYISNLKNLLEEELQELKESLETDIGDLTELSTTDKDSLVDAINEVFESLSNTDDNIGTLSSLTTEDKTSIVNAINELVTVIGSLDSLTTTDKTSAVNAINEVVSNIGTLSSLTTTDKTSIVAAINEVINSVDNSKCFRNIKEFGGIGNGLQDELAAFNAAFTSFGSNGGTLYVNGRYLISSGNLVIPDNVVITSDEKYFHANSTQTEFSTCNAILINPTYTIQLGDGAAINNIAILNSALTYPQNTDAGFAGTGITIANSGCMVTNLAIIGFNKGIYVTGDSSTLDNLAIDCINGLEITSSYDVNYISNIHFWPQIGGWDGDAATVKTNTFRNGDAIYIHGNADGTKISNIFVWNHVRGIRLSGTADMELDNIAVDNCTTGFIVINSNNILVTNFRAITGDSAIQCDGSSVNFDNGSIVNMIGKGVIFGASTPTQIGYVNISGFKFKGCGSAIFFNDPSTYMTKFNLVNSMFEACTEVYHYNTSNIFTNFSNIWYEGNTNIMVGTDGDTVIASASTLNLPSSNHFIVISGNTTINDFIRIAPDGDEITLLFDQALSLNDGTHLTVGGTLSVAAKTAYKFVNWNNKYYLIK